ncbi:tyrosine-type recombinase/integrase, partial [Streptomyces calidiresistens]
APADLTRAAERGDVPAPVGECPAGPLWDNAEVLDYIHRTFPEETTVTRHRLDALLTHTLIPTPHRALWSLLWHSTELRVEEALALDVEDINFEAGTIASRPTKTRRTTTVPLPDASAALVREAIAGRTTGPLLTTPGGDRITRLTATDVAFRHGHFIHDFRAGGRIHRASHRGATSPTS